MLAKGLLYSIFQDSFNKILFQQLTHDRSYISNTFSSGRLINPFPNTPFLDRPKFKEAAHDN